MKSFDTIKVCQFSFQGLVSRCAKLLLVLFFVSVSPFFASGHHHDLHVFLKNSRYWLLALK